MEKQRETKEFIAQFIEERQRLRQDEDRRVAEENAKIEKYAQMQEAKKAAMAQEKKANDAHRDQIYQRVRKINFDC